MEGVEDVLKLGMPASAVRCFCFSLCPPDDYATLIRTNSKTKTWIRTFLHTRGASRNVVKLCDLRLKNRINVMTWYYICYKIVNILDSTVIVESEVMF